VSDTRLRGAPTDLAPTSAPPSVRTVGVTKRYGRRGVLRGITLTVQPGERVALLGPNGAGKTTLLRILATLSRPTSGTVEIAGFRPDRDAQAVRSRLGVVAHQSYLYDDLTAEENLRFYARMYAVEDAAARIDEVLERVGLAGWRRERVRTFSRGMQQRLALARAMLHRPSVLLLDEPDSALDRAGVRILARLVEEHAAAGGTTVLTTHDLGLGLEVADRVVLLQQGQVVLDAPAADLDVAEIERRLGYR